MSGSSRQLDFFGFVAFDAGLRPGQGRIRSHKLLAVWEDLICAYVREAYVLQMATRAEERSEDAVKWDLEARPSVPEPRNCCDHERERQ